MPNSIGAQLERFTQEPVGKSKTARIDGNQRRRAMSSLPGRCVKNKVICSFPCKNLFGECRIALGHCFAALRGRDGLVWNAEHDSHDQVWNRQKSWSNQLTNST